MNPEASSRNEEHTEVLEPKARLKNLTNTGANIDVDPSVPVTRYFRSGIEMIRMGDRYKKEGQVEKAFYYYMRFLTLFIEKIRQHPGYDKFDNRDMKRDNESNLARILPIAEKLKGELLERYGEEYERHQAAERRRTEERRLNEASKRQKERCEVPGKNEVDFDPKCNEASRNICRLNNSPDLVTKYHVASAPDLGNVSYPTEAVAPPLKPNPDSWHRQTTTSPPVVNRESKPMGKLYDTSYDIPFGQLRIVVIPGNLIREFTIIAQKNTDRNIETCGILAGQLRRDQLVISHVLLPEQEGTADSCRTDREEVLFEFQDQHDLITFGWIHTHPTQTAFLSSVDLHTHCHYQRMMPEAVAIVCAPKYSENKVFFLTPEYGLNFIANCSKSGFHPHPTDPELYRVAGHVKFDPEASVNVVDLRIRK